MKFFCMEFKGHLYGVLKKKKSTVFQKANMRNCLRCLPPRVAAFSTHFLARRASLAVRDYTHKISISWVWREARVWSFDTMVNGTEETLDTRPLGEGLLPDLRKETNCASFLAWTLSPKDVMLGVMATILISGGKARELHNSQFSSKT